MIAYTYNEEGIFTGVVACQKNPRKSNEYLLPRNATFIAPPTGYTEDKIPSFNMLLNSWALIDSPLKIAENNGLLKLTNEYGVSLYYADENSKPVLRSIEDVESETALIKKNFDTEALKRAMDINIFLKAKEVTKGSSMESVQAFISSYQLRSANASEYVNDNLKAHYSHGNFLAGDLLDTEAKIIEYYKSLLILLDKFREAEINNYLTQKANL